MSYSILWTLLPAGIDRARQVAKLSLVASPRSVIVTKAFGESPLHQWPTIVGALGAIGVRNALAQSRTPIPATITSPAPSLTLWHRLFPANAPAEPFDKTDAPILVQLESAYSVGASAKATDALYAELLHGEATERLARGHPVAAKVAALADGGGAASRATTPGALGPLAETARKLRGRAKAAAARRTAAKAAFVPSLTKSIRSAEEVDVHQLIGMVMDHPALARRLGLVLDVEMPLFTGEAILRVVDANGQPLNGPIALAQPWSHVVCDPGRHLFVMKTQPDAPPDATEIVDGMVDLRPDDPGGKYTLTDLDVLSSALAIDELAQRMQAAPGLEPASLPGRRNGGLTLAQTDRAAKTLKHAVKRAARFDTTTDEIDGAPVLYADDVTVGYRVDVSQDGKPFRSLMERVVTYHGGDGKEPLLVVEDEGKVEAGSAVEGVDENGKPQLLAAEEMFTWRDWSLVAARPGPVAGDDGGAEFVGGDALPGFPLRVDVKARPGSLPRLRYGSVYRVRMRAVDPAGRSIAPGECNPALVSPPIAYRRLERIGAPQLVPRRAYSLGESQLRLVVRSDGDGNPIGPVAERHVLPPSISHDVAQMHGAFDAALGPDSPQRAAARDALLRIGMRQDSSINDPVVIGPGGTVLPAKGIRVAKLDPSDKQPLATLPLPRGTKLPTGQYVHHDADQMLVPWLVDPAAAAASFRGLRLSAEQVPIKAPVVVPFDTSPWPDLQAFRLVAQAGATASAEITRGGEGRAALTVTLAPAMTLVATMSTAPTAAAVRQMDPQGLADAATAQQGVVNVFSQPQQVTLVHAVQRPLSAPTMSLAATERPDTGNTWVRVRGSMGAHQASTGRVDVEASWTEIIDDGQGKVSFEPRRTVIGSIGFDAPGAQQSFEFQQSFGDTRRRRVTLIPVATTRFTDCFEPPAPGQERQLQREGKGVLVDVLSTQRPPAPHVHSCIPIFRWTRSVKGGVFTSVRRTAGVRVYLRPKWFVTGEGESLGVVLHASPQTAQKMQDSDDADLFTRWGRDPLRGGTDAEHPPLLASAVTNADSTLLLNDLPGATTDHTDNVYAIAAVPVQFDAERGMWFADVELDIAPAPTGAGAVDWAFVRLGLVRVQPGTVPPPAGKPSRQASSVVVTDFVQLPPPRTLVARRTGPAAVAVELGAINDPLSVVCTARWQGRMFEPLASKSPDIVVDGQNIEILTPPATGGAARVGTVSEPLAPATELVSSPAAFTAGRVVVTEAQSGFAISHEEGVSSRVVYREIVECAVFDRADGPV